MQRCLKLASAKTSKMDGTKFMESEENSLRHSFDSAISDVVDHQSDLVHSTVPRATLG